MSPNDPEVSLTSNVAETSGEATLAKRLPMAAPRSAETTTVAFPGTCEPTQDSKGVNNHLRWNRGIVKRHLKCHGCVRVTPAGGQPGVD